jgi:hypothetical protein
MAAASSLLAACGVLVDRPSNIRQKSLGLAIMAL